jgi:hypothetical protein
MAAAALVSLPLLNSCVDNDDYATVPVPPKEFYMETFDSIKDAASATHPKVNAAVGYDDTIVVYKDPTNRADIRVVSSVKSGSPFVWIPYNTQGMTPASFMINNLLHYTENRSNISLIYRFNDAAVYDPGTTSNTNKLILKLNDEEYPVPSKEITTANGRNTYVDVWIPLPDSIGGAKLNKIEFSNPTSNGFRLDDIKLVENYTPMKK